MYNQAKIFYLTVEEYLQLELESLVHYEYIAGQVYPIVTNSENKKIITGNILTRLRGHLLGKSCRVFSSDMKVKIEALDVFYHPDICVTSDLSAREKYFKTAPCLIIEIISPETERIHRNEKLMNYQQLKSLQEYVLVYQSEIKVDIYRKYNRQTWFLEQFIITDTMKLSSVGLEMAIAEIYEDVEFE
ncbi:MAG: Uma2 family endonuclease [Tolypothrix sp. Co-bin9]|nr:Uma2 family endonuclease [Tolypothrix sp. Co-bin9]